MRSAAFNVLLVLSALVAFSSVLWPWWDFSEAQFVSRLLGYMEKKQDEPGVWLGPRVEGSVTALVTGRMSVASPPKADPVLDFFPGKTYDGCAFAEQQFEVLEKGIFQGEWKAQGQKHILRGTGYKLGNWWVDPRLFDGALTPHHQLSDSASPVPCPPGTDECRVAERCVLLSDYSIIGNRGGDAAAGWRIELPNESLIDYPLFQSGLLPPAEFALQYKLRMAERIAIYPYLDAMFMLFLAGGMLVLSRREVEIGEILRKHSYAGVPAVVIAAIRANRTGLDHLCGWLALLLPLVPLAAYHAIADSALFNLLCFCYVAGYLVMAYGFIRRLRMAPEDLPRRDDIAL